MFDRQAAQQFNEALAKFQTNCPPIQKTSTAKIVGGGGAAFGYKYAELDEIATTIAPHLAASELAFTWDSSMTNVPRSRRAAS